MSNLSNPPEFLLPSLSHPNPKILTLVIPVQGDHCLLGLKKRGFGTGYWNGFGGKVKEGETVMDAAMREVGGWAEKLVMQPMTWPL